MGLFHPLPLILLGPQAAKGLQLPSPEGAQGQASLEPLVPAGNSSQLPEAKGSRGTGGDPITQDPFPPHPVGEWVSSNTLYSGVCQQCNKAQLTFLACAGHRGCSYVRQTSQGDSPAAESCEVTDVR